MANENNPLLGLSATDCCYDCNPDKGCVITGMALCGHPFKSGLQGAMKGDPKVVTRYNAARRMLHNQKLNVGGEEPAPARAAPARPRRKKPRRAKPKAPAAPAPAPASA